MKTNTLQCEDFDEDLPPEIKRRIRKTDFYRYYIDERARVSELAMAHIAKGGKLFDEKIADELNGFAVLVEKMRQVTLECECKQQQSAGILPCKPIPSNKEKRR